MDYQKFSQELPTLFNRRQDDLISPKSSQFPQIKDRIAKASINNTNIMQLLDFAVGCMNNEEIYCEIDSLGLTLISALVNHPEINAYCASSFSSLNNEEYYEELLKTLKEFNLDNQVMLCHEDAKTFLRGLHDINSKEKIGVCFLNCGNSYRDHFLNLLLLKEFLADQAIIITVITSKDIEQANQDFIASHKNSSLLLDWYPLDDSSDYLFLRLQIVAWDINIDQEVIDTNIYKSDENSKHLYLDLMKRCLMNLIYDNDQDMMRGKQGIIDEETGKITITEGAEYAPELKLIGGIWPSFAHTMIGLKRLDNLQFCIEDILAKNVEGDLIETGVWRGGATIFMRAILKAYSITDRVVWVADSFEGLPPTEYKDDVNMHLEKIENLAISLETVQSNFSKYGLLDPQVKFLKGWFKDTLPTAPVEKLALVRLDGDWYESTMDGLVNLYPKLSIGGYIIIDDYGAVKGCRDAVEDYRKEHNITEKIIQIDPAGVYWQRLK